MFTLQKLSEQAQGSLACLSEVSQSLSSLMEEFFEPVELSQGQDIGAGVYKVESDGIKLLLGEVALGLMQSNDIIVVLNPVNKNVTFKVEFNTPCGFISDDKLQELVESNHEIRDKIFKYLNCSIDFFSAVSSSAFFCELPVLPDIRSFPVGSKIISQGNNDSDVYTMIGGTAEVLVDGVVVGEISSDEIFGALSALTGELRSADVVAKTECTVICVKQEEFYKLLENKPQTSAKLVTDLANALLKTNKVLVQG